MAKTVRFTPQQMERAVNLVKVEIQQRAEIERLRARQDDRAELSQLLAKRNEELSAAIALIEECHDQYGMPVGLNERMRAFLDAQKRSGT